MQKLFIFLEMFTDLSPEAKLELTKVVKIKQVEKGVILLHEGDTCRNLYFVKSGFLRGYYFQDGKEFTSWFAFENDIATSLYSFVTQKTGLESIEVLEDSVVYCIEYGDLQNLYKQFMEMNLVGRILTEKYYITVEERKNSFQYLPAKERYDQIVKLQPKLLQRASLGMIASYLGISQETLSRIRNKI